MLDILIRKPTTDFKKCTSMEFFANIVIDILQSEKNIIYIHFFPTHSPKVMTMIRLLVCTLFFLCVCGSAVGEGDVSQEGKYNNNC